MWLARCLCCACTGWSESTRQDWMNGDATGGGKGAAALTASSTRACGRARAPGSLAGQLLLPIFTPVLEKNPAPSFAAEAPQEAHSVFQGRLGYAMEKPVVSANKRGTSLGFYSEVRHGKSKTCSAPGLIIAWPKFSLRQQRWSPCQWQRRLCSRAAAAAAGLSNLQAFWHCPVLWQINTRESRKKIQL